MTAWMDGLVNFTDIIKIVTMFFKTKKIKDSKKVKKFWIYLPKSNLYLHFLI